MNNYIKIALLLLFGSTIFAQETVKTDFKKHSNPILFIEGIGGISVLKNSGYSAGIELNYQIKNNLFSARYINSVGLKDTLVLIFPVFKNEYINNEYSFLYGKRRINKNHSYSFSGGISYNYFTTIAINEFGDNFSKKENYLGFPYEVNIKWFGSRKRKNILWNAAIPNLGVKMYGNFSKNSFIGIGFTFGLGFAKKY